MAAPVQRLVGESAEGLLAGALALARPASATARGFELALSALGHAATEHPQLVAPTFIVDLGVLLSGERLEELRLAVPDAGLRDALRAYEDHVLARLVADRRFVRLCEAVAASAKESQGAGVGAVGGQLLERWGAGTGQGVSQAALRRLATRLPGDVRQAGLEALEGPEVAARLASELRQVVRAARGQQGLLSDAEVFLAENARALRGLAARVALAQLATVAQAVEEALPAQVRQQSAEDPEAPTALEEASAFPVGGFASVSTHGAMENLVTSELMYLEPPGSPRPDLFDVRFVENELLYYARDESMALRRRRTLGLVFDASLAQARVLDAGQGVQRLVAVLGAMVALVRKLSRWMDTEALEVRLLFVEPGPEPRLHEEASVVGLVLKALQERGQLQVDTAASAAEAVATLAQEVAARARVVVLSARMPPGLEGASRPEALVDVALAEPRLWWVDGSGQAYPPGTAGLEALTLALLEGLVRPPRRQALAVRPSRPLP